MNKARIILADDESLFRKTTAVLLRRAGYEVTPVEDGHAAIRLISEQSADLLIADLNMPGNLQLELLSKGREKFPEVPIIVVTGRPTLPSAIESVRLGVHDYFLKPIEIEDLLHSIERALSRKPLQRTESLDGLESLVGESEPMLRLKSLARRVARSNANVLIRGESGTGKELLSRGIHAISGRANGPFVTIDCASIPEALMESTLFGHTKGAFTGATGQRIGLIQAADGGTAFLDEIGELPLSMQSKLLRVIQFGTFLPVGSSREEKVDVRIVAATHRDLKNEVTAGKFRQDLYFRLAVLELLIPPLRDRTEDIEKLSRLFLGKIAVRDHTPLKNLSFEALEQLRAYTWPGNVRELENIMERCACLSQGDWIGPEDLPEELTGRGMDSISALERKIDVFHKPDLSVASWRDESQKELLTQILESFDGNITKAAAKAGMSRQGLHKAMKRLGIEVDQFRKVDTN